MSEPVVIRCRQNGPYVVTGRVKVLDHEGNEFTPPPGKANIALCRCGHSKDRPFCDGSHRGAGFEAAELAPQSPGERPV